MTKYKEGDQTYVFMTWGAFDKRKKIKAHDVLFLAKVTIIKDDYECYTVRIDEPILKVSSLFPKGEVHRFAHLWVDRGEEAYKIWLNPSHR